MFSEFFGVVPHCLDLFVPIQVGRALSESGIPREELFIISKIDGLPTGDYNEVNIRVEAMLKALSLAHFDLLLIHHPLNRGADLSADPGSLTNEPAWAYFQENIRESWEIMSRLQLEGLAKQVGVSNFYLQHLEALDGAIKEMDAAPGAGEGSKKSAPVAAVQVFIDSCHPEDDLVAHCQSRTPPANVFAYRPVAFLPVLGFVESDAPGDEGSGKNLLESLEDAALAVGCSDARQLVLASVHGRNISPITSSRDSDRMSANFSAAMLAERYSHEEAKNLVPVVIQAHADDVSMMGGADEYASAFKEMGR
jgi:diketogulonate reductase-like aldo/keto reductase